MNEKLKMAILKSGLRNYEIEKLAVPPLPRTRLSQIIYQGGRPDEMRRIADVLDRPVSALLPDVETDVEVGTRVFA